MFLVLSSDPIRYRVTMLPAMHGRDCKSQVHVKTCVATPSL
jgi:hypothetical protein